MFRLFFIGFVISFSFLHAQNPISIEEIAFRHLIDLNQKDSAFKELNFSFKGLLGERETSFFDTLFCRGKSTYIKNPYGNNCIIDTKTHDYFKINKEWIWNKGSNSLKMDKHLKYNNKYYIYMSLATSIYEGKIIVFVLNEKGDLLQKCLNSYIY